MATFQFRPWPSTNGSPFSVAVASLVDEWRPLERPISVSIIQSPWQRWLNCLPNQGTEFSRSLSWLVAQRPIGGLINRLGVHRTLLRRVLWLATEVPINDWIIGTLIRWLMGWWFWVVMGSPRPQPATGKATTNQRSGNQTLFVSWWWFSKFQSIRITPWESQWERRKSIQIRFFRVYLNNKIQ